MTTMLDERFARLRTHRNNVARYRRLLKTHLTDLERQFIERRLSEEQSEFELLSGGILPRHSYDAEHRADANTNYQTRSGAQNG